jgi:talin
MSELSQCARNVTDSVLQLLDNIKAAHDQIIQHNLTWGNSGQANQHLYRQDECIERIFQATDSLFESMGNGPEMIRQAKLLAQSTTDLINALKQEAHVQPTSEQQRKLLLAAKLLAEATSKIVEAAKACASSPNDERTQSVLRRAAEELKNATTVAAGDNLQLKLIKRLELAAKQVF